MHIEVDQSRKIEQTAVDTFLAFSDGEQCALLIPAKVKRQALAYLRGQEKSRKSSIVLVFSAALFLLLKEIAEQITHCGKSDTLFSKALSSRPRERVLQEIAALSSPGAPPGTGARSNRAAFAPMPNNIGHH